MNGAMIIFLMGVAGSGKTTVGELLAEDLGWPFRDADEFHPAANVAKMSAGTPLTDADRAPWLQAIRRAADDVLRRNGSAVITCSALRQRYREELLGGPMSERKKLVYLRGSRELLWQRISGRKNHFMKPEMLDSQLAALEEPENAIIVDVSPTPPEIVAAIRRALAL